MYLFDDYTLHTQLYELRYAGAPCPLEPQVLDMLLYLIQHRDRVVSRQELLDHIWPERFISETSLDHRLMQVRQAIGDSGQRQCRIKTLRGRGYRFVAAVEERLAAAHHTWHVTAPQPQGLDMACARIDRCSTPLANTTLQLLLTTAGHPGSAAVSTPAVLVGRHAELAQLHQWYTAALQGTRQVVLVTGEAGIGKTTLVDAFIAQVVATESVWVGRGQCIEQHGAGEAYLPLLEALGRLGCAPEERAPGRGITPAGSELAGASARAGASEASRGAPAPGRWHHA